MSDMTYKPKLVDIPGKGGGKPQPYLQAHEAITWFRSDFPAPRSRIVPIVNLESKIVRAEIYIDDVMVSAADVMNPGDGNNGKSLEKLETAAVRRALAFLGYGTTAAIAAEADEGSSRVEASTSARADMAKQTAKQQPKEQRRMGGEQPKPTPAPTTEATSEQEGEPDDDPAATEPKESTWERPNWLEALHEDAKTFLEMPDLTMNEMARLAGIKKEPKVKGYWVQKYVTPDEALVAMKDQLEFEMLA